MSLRDFKPRTEVVEIPNGDGQKITVTVRGLTPAEVSELIKKFKEDALKIYDVITGLDLDSVQTENDFFTRIVAMLSDIPNIAANVIAQACDEPDAADYALRLPLFAQYAIISKVGALTFTVDGDLKKLLANMTTKLGDANGLMTLITGALDTIVPKKPLVSGVGNSENP